jgi:hypothetical protein
MAATNVQAFSGDVEISSNLEVGTANLFVDTINSRVGIGRTDPSFKLDVNGTLHSTDMNINDYIYHNGDTNTYFGFSGADSFKIVEGGSSALEINSSGNIDIPNYIRHIGDTDTYFGFSGADSFKIVKGGSSALEITSDGHIDIDGRIRHLDDLDTYIEFLSNTLRVVSESVERFRFDSSGLKFSSLGGQYLNYYNYAGYGSIWVRVGGAGGFYSNGGVQYVRVGTMTAATFSYVSHGLVNTAYYYTNTSAIPSQYRPAQSVQQVQVCVTNSSFTHRFYYQSGSARWFYTTMNAGSFSGGGGTTHQFPARTLGYYN